nr:MAG TPA: hypothetical protein [Caudoviricetes sp.]
MADTKKPVLSLAQLKRLHAKCMAKISELSDSVSETVTELSGKKADKVAVQSLTIPANGWMTDNSTFPKYVDIDISGLTADDVVCVIVPPSAAAKAAVICTVSESLAGKLRIRAQYVPTADITATYYIVR